ncbi:MAG: M20/M25/M40 family metallo-hydrolase [Symbiobacteriaceae bacterium]|nr:M20/M25/M40 family metallo-hydrolase [Symbiobacteriaceae bacterium]
MEHTKLQQRIEKLLLAAVKYPSFTNANENCMEDFFAAWVSTTPYFTHQPANFGFYPIPEDHLQRRVFWCLLQGKSAQTVVLVNHHDVVDTKDFGNLEPLALEPHLITAAYCRGERELAPEIAAEAASGEWLFGRGVGDMKGGIALQLALLEGYMEEPDFPGNIVFISVPDEENLSAGMMGAVRLLKELQEKHGLEYTLMLNCEPHTRLQEEAPVVSIGSIGKLLPVFYVRGKLVHVAHVYEGLNPLNILGDIIHRSELNPDFIERVGNTVSPPPTYLAARDSKVIYDVSLPLAAMACFSVLTLKQTPAEVLQKLKDIAYAAFDAVVADANYSYRRFCRLAGVKYNHLPWQSRVLFFDELYAEALRDAGDTFVAAYEETLRFLVERIEISAIDCVSSLIETTLLHVKDASPVVVIALSPPYYPGVHNSALQGQAAEKVAQVLQDVAALAATLYSEPLLVEDYFVAISDLSYAMFTAGAEDVALIGQNMPGWGEIYHIPLDLVRELSMPVANIGPWGKDLHKYSERVYLPDLYYRTPVLVDYAIRRILER